MYQVYEAGEDSPRPRECCFWYWLFLFHHYLLVSDDIDTFLQHLELRGIRTHQTAVKAIDSLASEGWCFRLDFLDCCNHLLVDVAVEIEAEVIEDAPLVAGHRRALDTHFQGCIVVGQCVRDTVRV